MANSMISENGKRMRREETRVYKQLLVIRF